MSTDNKYAPISAAAIKASVKDYGRLMANTVGEDLWITNSYWAVPATHQFGAMLKTYGLPAEPGVWDWYGKDPVRSESTPPRIDRVIPADRGTVEKSDGWSELAPLHIDGLRGLVFSSADVPAVILTDGNGLTLGANWSYLQAFIGGIDLHASDDGLGATIRRTASARSERRRVRIFAQKGKATSPLVVIVETESYVSAQPGTGVKSGNVWGEDLRAVLMPVRLS